MRVLNLFLLLSLALALQSNAQTKGKRIKLFDGRTFKGWEGDTLKNVAYS